MGTELLTSLAAMGGVGLVLGLILAFASKKFFVKIDPRIEKITEILPGVNCGACGYAGCSGYAEGIVLNDAPINSCAPGGESVTRLIADIMGTDAESTEAMVAAVHCKGGNKEALVKYKYQGITDCRAAVLLADGDKKCAWGCLGLGSCVEACAFDAIHVNENGVAVVDPKKCTGCGKCIAACPKNIIDLMPVSTKIFLACSNHDRGAKVKKYCSVGCTGCTLCEKNTPSGAIKMENFLPVQNYAIEENFVTAAYKCPQKCFTDLVAKRPKVSIDKKCTGCTECVKVCPVKGAIEGEENRKHKVVFEKCIGCGRCISVCPEKAINLMGALGYQNGR